jgi:hypothetical protein
MCRVAPTALRALKQRVRETIRRNGGRSMRSVVVELRKYLPGWKEYFRLADTPRAFIDHDKWIRHRLRALQLKHWKRGPKGLCRAAQTRRSRGRCSASRREHPPVVAQLGDVRACRSRYPLLRSPGSTQTCPLTSTFRTAGCGPACPVVWQGCSGAPLPPMPMRCRGHERPVTSRGLVPV